MWLLVEMKTFGSSAVIELHHPERMPRIAISARHVFEALKQRPATGCAGFVLLIFVAFSFAHSRRV